MIAPVLALDVGGTKVAAALVDGTGRLLRRAQQATPSGPMSSGSTPSGEVWDAVASVLDEARGSSRVHGVGIACGGPLDARAGTVSPINIAGWADFPLVERVAGAVPGVPVVLAGDAVCLALGEQRHGAGRGREDLLGVVVSTGVGGGLVAAGRPVGGRTGNAGHVGHVVVEPDGDRCSCGGRGCLETVAAGPHLVRRARERGWRGDGDAAALAADARAGDPVARAVFRRAGSALGAALVSVAAVCDLDLVVLGGGVTGAGPLLLNPVHEALDRHAGLGFLRGLRVVPAALGDAAGLVGAAALLDG